MKGCAVWNMIRLLDASTIMPNNFQKFFRRGLTEFQNYACKEGGQCPITPRTRNQCRYCRYMACLKAGMSREGNYLKVRESHLDFLVSFERHFVLKHCYANHTNLLCSVSTAYASKAAGKVSLRRYLPMLILANFTDIRTRNKPQ